MCGSGSSGGGSGSSGTDNEIKQTIVKFSDGVTLVYREYRGKVYELESGRATDEIPLSMNQIVERAKKNGGEVTTFNQSQLEEYEKQRKKERIETDKMHDKEWFKKTYPKMKGK